MEAERVRALGALCNLQYNKKLAAKKTQETYFLRNQHKEKWIEDYVDSETSVAKMPVEDAERASKQEREDMRKAEEGEITT